MMDAGESLYSERSTRVSAIAFKLRHREAFAIQHGSRSHTDVLFLKLESEGIATFGEASLPPYLKWDAPQVMRQWREVHWQKLLRMDMEEALQYLRFAMPAGPARAALDIALHDLYARRKQLPLSALLGVARPERLATSFTIGICESEAELALKINKGRAFQSAKLKLGSDRDAASIAQFCKGWKGAFGVDVNQGWKDRDKAAFFCEQLPRDRVLYVEQPMPEERDEDMMWLRERFELPFVADESVAELSDLQKRLALFDGFNIKLMKCGGFSEAMDMMKFCRDQNKRILVGSMVESSCGIAAGAHLATGSDWADLDATLMLAEDPFEGLVVDRGCLSIKGRLGMGVKPRA